jgi:putative intracellular protease/amidase
VDKYNTMAKSEEMQKPLSWSSPDFTLDAFDLVLFPGGHDKAVRQIIDSTRVHELVLKLFPQTKKPGNKAVAAICHGVMVLSESKDNNGESAIRNCTTTTLPAGMESGIYWATRAFLGDYYKTYGAGSDNTEEYVSS